LKSDAANTCVLNNIAGYGQKTGAGQPTIEPCTASNCANCLATSTLCVECTSTYALKNDVTNQCFLRSTTAYYGPTPADPKIITKCSVSNCQWCSTTYADCSECDTNYSLISGRSDLCHLTTSIYPGYGYDSVKPATPSKIYPCSDSSCSDCQANIQVCRMCTIASGKYVKKSDNKCYLNTIVGYGLDNTQPNYLEICQLSTCLNCFSDYSYCQILASGKREMALIALSFDSSRNIANLKFDSLINVKQFKTLLSIFMKDATGKGLSGVSIKSIDMAVNSTGVDILIEHSLNVNDTKMEVIAIDSSISVFTYVDAEFPASTIITIKGINLVSAVTLNDKKKVSSDGGISILAQKNGQTTTVAVGTSFSASAQIISSASSLGASTLSTASFGSFLKLISVLEYLSMTNGNRTVLSEQFLNLFRASPLDIINNPIAVEEYRLNCTPTDNFARENISCNVMNNYGSDFMTLFLLLGIVLILIVVNYLVKRLKKNRRTVYKTLYFLFFIPNALVNAEMFVAVIDGSHIELSRIAFINIFNTNSKLAQIIGVTISACLLVFYSVYAWMLYRTSREFSADRKLNDKSKISKLLAFNFEEFRADARWPLSYYTPVLIILKNMTSQLTLVLLGGRSVMQLYALILIEVIGVGLAVLQTSSQKGWRTYGRIVVSICYCAILALYIVLNTDFKGSVRTYGITLCALYSIIIGLALIQMIEDFILGIGAYYRQSRMRCSKRERVKPTETLPLSLYPRSQPCIQNRPENKLMPIPSKTSTLFDSFKRRDIAKRPPAPLSLKNIKSNNEDFSIYRQSIQISQRGRSQEYPIDPKTLDTNKMKSSFSILYNSKISKNYSDLKQQNLVKSKISANPDVPNSPKKSTLGSISINVHNKTTLKPRRSLFQPAIKIAKIKLPSMNTNELPKP
jgi:hypothetical protein